MTTRTSDPARLAERMRRVARLARDLRAALEAAEDDQTYLEDYTTETRAAIREAETGLKEVVETDLVGLTWPGWTI